MSKVRTFRIVVLYIVLAIAVGVSFMKLGWFWRYRELARYGVETRGVVTRTNCSNHQTFKYHFEVAGRSFEAVGREGIANTCSALAIGDPVIVFYIPSDPDVNVSGDVKAHLRNEVISIALAAAVLPGLLIWLYVRLRKASGT